MAETKGEEAGESSKPKEKQKNIIEELFTDDDDWRTGAFVTDEVGEELTGLDWLDQCDFNLD